MTEPIRFDDGAAYERGMGVWSNLVGNVFLDWLDPAPGQRWVDVGCGSGAFTELVTQRCAPTEMQGVDPSNGQIAYAQTRPGAQGAHFQIGDAQSLPFHDASFDAAVMALVIFFVPDPRRGVAEMRRVVRPGGLVAAYAWDILGGGFPFQPMQAELRARGFTPTLPPQAAVAQAAPLHALWSELGLTDIRQREITVTRRFEDFADFWEATLGMGTIRATVDRFSPAEVADFQASVRTRLPAPDPSGAIAYSARAHAITGRVPAA